MAGATNLNHEAVAERVSELGATSGANRARYTRHRHRCIVFSIMIVIAVSLQILATDAIAATAAAEASAETWLGIMGRANQFIDARNAKAAQPFLLRAMHMLDRNSVTDIRVTVTLRYLGDNYRDLSDNDAAAKCYEEEAALLNRLSPEYPDLAYDYYQLGRIALDNCEFKKAEDLLEKSLRIRTQHQRLYKPKQNEITLNLAIAEALDGKLADASKRVANDLTASQRDPQSEIFDMAIAYHYAFMLEDRLKLSHDHPLRKLRENMAYRCFQIAAQARNRTQMYAWSNELNRFTPHLSLFCREQLRNGDLDQAWQFYCYCWLSSAESDVTKIALLQEAARRCSIDLAGATKPSTTVIARQVERCFERNMSFVEQHFASLSPSVHQLDSQSFFLLAQLYNQLGASELSRQSLMHFGEMIEQHDRLDTYMADGWKQLAIGAEKQKQQSIAITCRQHSDDLTKRLQPHASPAQ